jgi:hypothetical protein
MDSQTPEQDKKAAGNRLADLSPEQFRTLLSSDLKKSAPVVRTESPQSSRRRMLWAALILVAALVYVVTRFTAAPAKVIVINTSGEDAADVVISSGNQRVDLGGVGNGDVRQVEIVAGKPLHIDYTFEQRRVWTDSNPLTSFQSITVFIGMDKKLRVVRESPWSRQPAPPDLSGPPAGAGRARPRSSTPPTSSADNR